MTEPSRRVQRAARRLADQQTARVADVPSTRLLIASVATVTAAAGTDGGAVVTVRWRGDEVTAAAYLTSQAPVVDMRCLCALVDNQLIILGRLGGFPPEQ